MRPTDRKRRPGRPRHPIGREKLLEIACAQFATRGRAGASMAEVAAAAGLRKASLFHHFESKEDLYRAVLAGALRDLGAPLSEAWVEGGPFLGRLDRLAECATDVLVAHPDAARLLLRELLDGGPFLGEPDAVRGALEDLAAFLQEGMLEGAIPSQDPYQLALSLASLHLGFLAAPAVVADLLEADLDDPAARAARRGAVVAQTRRICGVG